jgi:ribosomal protein S18 acetylase RimI-like enzyme
VAVIRPGENGDGELIQSLAARVELFEPEEITVVNELWAEYLQKGAEQSGYYFLLAVEDENLLGFACYGPRPLTIGTFDLYWIAVDSQFRNRGIGKKLLRAVEQDAKQRGGRLLVAETSGTEDYTPTRKFYLSAGYLAEAQIHDFYKEGDDLVIFTHRL